MPPSFLAWMPEWMVVAFTGVDNKRARTSAGDGE